MKNPILITLGITLLFGLIATVQAQVVSIKRNDSTSVTIKVKGTDYGELIASNGVAFPLNQIATITFLNYRAERDSMLVNKLQENGFNYHRLIRGQVKLDRTGQEMYLGFIHDGKSFFWRKHFDLGERIENRLPELFQVKNITQDRAKTYADLVDFIPKNGGNLYSGRIIAENDSIGYTITLRGISARMGSNSNAAMSILAGVQSNSTPWEVAPKMKNGKFTDNTKKGLTILDEQFTQLFSF